jgi:DNA-binding Xre family transcriptional regulator
MKLDKTKLEVAMGNKCISTKGLCENAGIAQISLQRILANKSTPRPATIGKIAKALNVSVADIIE